jgi:hypothetical protein
MMEWGLEHDMLGEVSKCSSLWQYKESLIEKDVDPSTTTLKVLLS